VSAGDKGTEKRRKKTHPNLPLHNESTANKRRSTLSGENWDSGGVDSDTCG
jgi:hypothetical protein